MNPVEVRAARLGDAAALAELSTQLGYPTSPAQAEERLRRILDANSGAVLVAFLEDGGLVGWVHVFVALRVESDPFAELGGFVVAEDHRARGIGKRLLAAAEEWALRQGPRKLRVRSRSGRVDAHAFYEHLGFAKSKQQDVLDKTLPSSTAAASSAARASEQ